MSSDDYDETPIWLDLWISALALELEVAEAMTELDIELPYVLDGRWIQ